MATKDLNLSLDRALLRPNVSRERKAANGDRRPVAAPAGKRPAGKRPTPKPVPQQPAPWQSMAVACIAVANMLFLVLAGAWLSTYAERQSPPADISARLDRIDRSISTLEQQLADLQVAGNAQQQLIVSAYQSIGDQLEARTDLPSAAAQAQPASGEPAAVPTAADNGRAAGDWYVDLGSFASRKAALDAQKNLLALGYQARMQAPDGNTPAHTLILADFESRASAELVATALMERTELESVSVWKRE